MPDSSESTTDFVLLTERRFESWDVPEDDWYRRNLLADERLLVEALEARGASWQRLDWARPGVDWSRFRRAVFRTTWDYFDRLGEFRSWLDRVVAATTLVNSAELVRWNLDKRYLLDLERAGVDVVPTRYCDRDSGETLEEILDAEAWPEVVVKPAVSGAGRETFRASRTDLAGASERFGRLLAVEPMLVQPFQPAILADGEVTLVVIDGEVTHAVRKVAKPGEFRVQDDHGGRVVPHEPTEDEAALARRALAASPTTPVYGRVDLVRGPDGRPRVMELELIEPELFFRFCPPAAERLAEALVATLG